MFPNRPYIRDYDTHQSGYASGNWFPDRITLAACRVADVHLLCSEYNYGLLKIHSSGTLLYASRAWWGFATVQDQQKINGFLRQSTRIGFCSPDLPNFYDLCLHADQSMFSKVLRNQHHVLLHLHPVSTTLYGYSLRGPTKHRTDHTDRTSLYIWDTHGARKSHSGADICSRTCVAGHRYFSSYWNNFALENCITLCITLLRGCSIAQKIVIEILTEIVIEIGRCGSTVQKIVIET